MSRRMWLMAVAVLLLGLLPASLAWGHALLVGSIPTPGEAVAGVPQIVLRFNSRIEKALSSVALLGPGQSTIALQRSDGTHGPDTLAYRVPALAAGRYQAKWTVLSSDGHFTAGVLTFQVTGTSRPE
jgi:methionine-rich copper-binding protein CopC